MKMGGSREQAGERESQADSVLSTSPKWGSGAQSIDPEIMT